LKLRRGVAMPSHAAPDFAGGTLPPPWRQPPCPSLPAAQEMYRSDLKLPCARLCLRRSPLLPLVNGLSNWEPICRVTGGPYWGTIFDQIHSAGYPPPMPKKKVKPLRPSRRYGAAELFGNVISSLSRERFRRTSPDGRKAALRHIG
jgi:hypothetical protein